MRLILSLFIALFFSLNAFSQNAFQFGILPAININKKVSDKWKLNFKTESRQSFLEGIFGEDNSASYQYVLTDFSLLASKKMGLNNSLSGGYLIRIRGERTIHRLIQQFAIPQKLPAIVLAHRISTDQTFEKEEAGIFRLRYRISAVFPLNGQSLDPGEFYLKFNHEYLNILEDGQYDLEIRLVPFLGYAFTGKNKLEAGLDYRINSFIRASSESSFWISLNWYISF